MPNPPNPAQRALRAAAANRHREQAEQHPRASDAAETHLTRAAFWKARAEGRTARHPG